MAKLFQQGDAVGILSVFILITCVNEHMNYVIVWKNQLLKLHQSPTNTLHY